MARTSRSERQLRATVPLVGVLLVLIVFGVRLFDLQVVSAAAINQEADGRRGVVTTLWAMRGPIVDVHGATLANSVDRFDITMAPVNMAPFPRVDKSTKESTDISVEQAFAEIAAITGIDGRALHAEIDAMLAHDPTANFAYVARQVTLEQYEAIRELRIPWIYVEPHALRTYPGGAVAGNLLGFTGGDGAPLAGLELQYDECLAGANGQEMYERSRDDVVIPGSVVEITKPKVGATLKLTIDADVQWQTQQIIAEQVTAMQARYGTITIVDVKSGAIVAAAEYPTVDPNTPGSAEVADRGSRTFTAPFEPGSIMKPLTAASLYDAGVVAPTDTLLVPDTFDQNDALFSDALSHPPTTMNMNGVLADSSNVGIALFGERLSAAERRDYLVKFGFTETTNVGFIGEESGLMRPSDEWDAQTNYATMFGHGMTVTVAQMAGAYQALANGGVRLPLQLVSGCEHADGTVTDAPGGDPVTVVSEQAAKLALEGLESTAREGSLADQIAVPGYRVGMKTGTAQVVNPETGLYEADSYYASIAGVAPIDDPRFAIVVTMANPVKLTGSAATAASWQQATSHVLSAYQVPPSPQPWPELSVIH